MCSKACVELTGLLFPVAVFCEGSLFISGNQKNHKEKPPFLGVPLVSHLGIDQKKVLYMERPLGKPPKKRTSPKQAKVAQGQTWGPEMECGSEHQAKNIPGSNLGAVTNVHQPAVNPHMEPWVKIQIVVNIRFNPTTKIGPKMGGEFTYPPKLG